jgi:diacylglycerol kinase
MVKKFQQIIMENNFSLVNRFKSFTYAWSGIKELLRTEHNTWIHLFLTIIAVILALVFNIAIGEWTALIICMTMVWTAEIFNTCIEKLLDFISTDRHPQIKNIKDMAAAAVLMASWAAIIIGAIIFIPKIFVW